MGAGVPVVATDIPGTREAVENEVTGLLVPPRDPQSARAAMRRVFGDTASARAERRERASAHDVSSRPRRSSRASRALRVAARGPRA
jgi:glycosyltransferase involved in cell wall biosynthesis